MGYPQGGGETPNDRPARMRPSDSSTHILSSTNSTDLAEVFIPFPFDRSIFCSTALARSPTCTHQCNFTLTPFYFGNPCRVANFRQCHPKHHFAASSPITSRLPCNCMACAMRGPIFKAPPSACFEALNELFSATFVFGRLPLSNVASDPKRRRIDLALAYLVAPPLCPGIEI